MGKIKFCKHCGKVVEFTESSTMEGGQLITYSTCANCGNSTKITKNHVHYGDDAKK